VVSEKQAPGPQKEERFLASARIQVDAGDFDSAAGRAYYAMFRAAGALPTFRGREFKSDHRLISAYGQEFVKRGELPAELHRALMIAFELRNLAGYFSAFVVDEERARARVAQAEEFMQAAAGWLERNGA